jgi:(p)ppGpp synthase/HD superfamily hydrolase
VSLDIAHAFRVARQLSDDGDAWLVGLLHDVLEDTDLNAAFMIASGVPSHVVEAVVVLTKHPTSHMTATSSAFSPTNWHAGSSLQTFKTTLLKWTRGSSLSESATKVRYRSSLDPKRLLGR